MKLSTFSAAVATLLAVGARPALSEDPDAPRIVWSTDVPSADVCVVDAAGNLFALGPNQSGIGLVRLNGAGAIVRSHVIGGPVLKVAGAAFDRSGGLWIGGRTTSTAAAWNKTPLGLPLPAGTFAERGFVARLVEAPGQPSGWIVESSSLVFADVRGLAVNSGDAVWVAGDSAPDYPWSTQAWVAKIPGDGSAPTALSVAPEGHGDALALGPDGSAYVVGETSLFTTTPGAYEPRVPDDEIRVPAAFVVRVDPGMNIVYGTVLAGRGGPMGASAVAVDPTGAAVVAGWTRDDDLDVRGGFQLDYRGGSTFGVNRGDAFVAKFDPLGTDLLYSSYLGGSGDDRPSAVCLDAQGRILLVGATASADFPSLHAFGAPVGASGDQAFVSAVSAAGDTLRYSSLVVLGGLPTAVVPLARGAFAVASGRKVSLVLEPNSPPLSPVDVRAARIAGLRAQISWIDASDDETGFVVSRAADGGPAADIATLSAGTTAYVDAGIAADASYRYRVRARNAAGESAAGEAAVTGAAPGWTVERTASKVKRSRLPGRDRLTFRVALTPTDASSSIELFAFVQTEVFLIVGEGADAVFVDAAPFDPALGIPTNPQLPGWSTVNRPWLGKWTWNSPIVARSRARLKLSTAKGRIYLTGDVRDASIARTFPRRPSIAVTTGDAWGATTK